MRPHAYYNEFEPFAAEWLRNLIAAGLIPPGDVDERSISDVSPSDLAGYVQCHFFAGLGGWAYACRLAGWPDDRPVWTGSCPCQPFSAAGRNGGFADERHLWPHWFHLISVCRPAVVFGEQVASPDGLAWLDLVQADLEGAGYACGAVDLCAAGVGAPHIRQRLWFVANAVSAGRSQGRPIAGDRQIARSGATGIMANTDGRECDGLAGSWSDAEWLPCRDGKARPVEPGTFPLAHGVSGRVGRLRAYGNAVVPQVAAEVIAAFMEVV